MPKKAGRPKLKGIVREPNGRASRSDRVLHIQRKLDAIRKLGMEAEMGTPLGQLLTWERITKHQYEAGTWFAEARKDADAACSFPPRNAPAQNMNALHGAASEEDTPEQIARKRRVIETCAKAEAVLGHGSRRYRAVMWVCVFERRHEGEEMFRDLVEGLSLLAAHRTSRRAA